MPFSWLSRSRNYDTLPDHTAAPARRSAVRFTLPALAAIALCVTLFTAATWPPVTSPSARLDEAAPAVAQAPTPPQPAEPIVSQPMLQPPAEGSVQPEEGGAEGTADEDADETGDVDNKAADSADADSPADDEAATKDAVAPRPKKPQGTPQPEIAPTDEPASEPSASKPSDEAADEGDADDNEDPAAQQPAIPEPVPDAVQHEGTPGEVDDVSADDDDGEEEGGEDTVPTPAPTAPAPTPAPVAETPAPTSFECKGKHSHMVKGHKLHGEQQEYCVECPDEKSIVWHKGHEKPVCVRNHKGEGCKTILFDHDKPKCFDDCSKHALIIEHSTPTCVKNSKGENCKDIEVEHGTPKCFDFCPHGAKQHEHGQIACVRNYKGKACKHVKWSDKKAECFDRCVEHKGKVRHKHGKYYCSKHKVHSTKAHN